MKVKRTKDCYNAVVYGDKVRCKLGHELDPKRYAKEASYNYVLRGHLLNGCRLCKDYEGDWK